LDKPIGRFAGDKRSASTAALQRGHQRASYAATQTASETKASLQLPLVFQQSQISKGKERNLHPRDEKQRNTNKQKPSEIARTARQQTTSLGGVSGVAIRGDKHGPLSALRREEQKEQHGRLSTHLLNMQQC
jgi:hypothetical protein